MYLHLLYTTPDVKFCMAFHMGHLELYALIYYQFFDDLRRFSRLYCVHDLNLNFSTKNYFIIFVHFKIALRKRLQHDHL